MTGQMHQNDPEAGARNLLVNCAGVSPDDHVLIVSEEPGGCHYDEAAALCVEKVARQICSKVTAMPAPLPKKAGDFPAELIEAMNVCDHTVFLSRLADHARFMPSPGKCSKTICYALDEELLGSPYATLPHGLMTKLLRKLEAELSAARMWTITCPLGTDAHGTFEWRGDKDEDFTFGLFPVTTFKPVPCVTMTGKVALAHWLIPGGKANYEPAFHPISKPVFAHVRDGKLCSLEGDREAVEPLQDHCDMVAAKFGIDRDFVHSWHVGLNPHTFYAGDAHAELERWGSVSFSSPRYLHFHTCGDYAPGEIAWSVFDPTVAIDGVEFWREGSFVWLERPDNAALIAGYPGAECLFEMRRDLGVGF